jgi:hypothetical protein
VKLSEFYEKVLAALLVICILGAGLFYLQIRDQEPVMPVQAKWENPVQMTFG